MSPLGFVALAIVVGLGMYAGVGGLFEWRYYRRRRDRAAEWKLQPHRFAPPRVRRRDVLLGGGNLLVGSILSGLLASAVAGADNPTAIYFAGHGLGFALATTAGYFIVVDFARYCDH